MESPFFLQATASTARAGKLFAKLDFIRGRYAAPIHNEIPASAVEQAPPTPNGCLKNVGEEKKNQERLTKEIGRRKKKTPEFVTFKKRKHGESGHRGRRIESTEFRRENTDEKQRGCSVRRGSLFTKQAHCFLLSPLIAATRTHANLVTRSSLSVQSHKNKKEKKNRTKETFTKKTTIRSNKRDLKKSPIPVVKGASSVSPQTAYHFRRLLTSSHSLSKRSNASIDPFVSLLRTSYSDHVAQWSPPPHPPSPLRLNIYRSKTNKVMKTMRQTKKISNQP